MKDTEMLEICRFSPEEINETIERLDGLQGLIVPLLRAENHQGRGKQDAKQFKRDIMLAKHALIAMGDMLEAKMKEG